MFFVVDLIECVNLCSFSPIVEYQQFCALDLMTRSEQSILSSYNLGSGSIFSIDEAANPATGPVNNNPKDIGIDCDCDCDDDCDEDDNFVFNFEIPRTKADLEEALRRELREAIFQGVTGVRRFHPDHPLRKEVTFIDVYMNEQLREANACMWGNRDFLWETYIKKHYRVGEDGPSFAELERLAFKELKVDAGIVLSGWGNSTMIIFSSLRSGWTLPELALMGSLLELELPESLFTDLVNLLLNGWDSFGGAVYAADNVFSHLSIEISLLCFYGTNFSLLFCFLMIFFQIFFLRDILLIVVILDLSLSFLGVLFSLAGYQYFDMFGSLFFFLLLSTAACETALALGFLVSFSRRHSELTVDSLRFLSS